MSAADSPPFDPGYIPPGAMVGPYQVQTRIAQGGFGALYRVIRNGKAYALKVALRPEGVSAAEHARLDERAAREVAMLQCLRHPNIVRVHAFDRWPDLETGFPFLVMELIEGTRLRDWQRQTKPSAAAIARVFQKLALALAEMHRAGIWHRDLKSENVLIRADGEPVIVDFGISRLRDAAPVTQCDSLLGTYTHFSPEYCRFFLEARYEKGERFTQWESSDLHALGVMLYEALTGHPPFEREGRDEETSNPAAAPFRFMELIAHQVPRRPRAWNAAVPDALDALCMKLLEKNPEDRFTNALTLAKTLEHEVEHSASAWDGVLLEGKPSPASGAADDGEEPAVPPPPPTDEVSELLIPSVDVIAEESPRAAEPASAGDATRTPEEVMRGRAVPTVSAPAPLLPPSPATGEAEVGNRAPRSRKLDGELPSVLRRARDDVRAAIAAGDRRRRRRWLPVVVLAAAFALILGLVVVGATTNRTTPGTTGASAVQHLASPAPLEESAVPVLPEAEVLPPTSAGSQPTQLKKPTTAHEDIDRLLAQHYGEPLPAQRSGWAAERGRSIEGDRPAWMRRARMNVAEAVVPPDSVSAPTQSTESELPVLPVPFGALLKARLTVDLDSTALDGPVEATVTHDFPGAPRGTRLIGRATVSGARFRIEFDRAIQPDGTVERCEALAVERGTRMPGVRAQVTVARSSPEPNGLVQTVATHTATLLLGQADSSLPQQSARIAGEAALEGVPHAQPTRQDRLSLPRGTTFDVFIERSRA